MTDHLHPIDRVEDITPARLRHYAAILIDQGRCSPARVVGLCAERIAELEAEVARYKEWHSKALRSINRASEMYDAMEDRAEAAEAALERVRGLPDRVREKMDKWALRINVDNGRMVPPPDGVDGEWITVRMANKMIRDELAAALCPDELAQFVAKQKRLDPDDMRALRAALQDELAAVLEGDDYE